MPGGPQGKIFYWVISVEGTCLKYIMTILYVVALSWKRLPYILTCYLCSKVESPVFSNTLLISRSSFARKQTLMQGILNASRFGTSLSPSIQKCPSVLQLHNCHRHHWDKRELYRIWTMFSSSILSLRKAGAALEHSTSSDHGDVNNEKQCHACHRFPISARFTVFATRSWVNWQQLLSAVLFLSSSNIKPVHGSVYQRSGRFYKCTQWIWDTGFWLCQKKSFTWLTDKHEPRVATITSLYSQIEILEPVKKRQPGTTGTHHVIIAEGHMYTGGLFHLQGQRCDLLLSRAALRDGVQARRLQVCPSFMKLELQRGGFF